MVARSGVESRRGGMLSLFWHFIATGRASLLRSSVLLTSSRLELTSRKSGLGLAGGGSVGLSAFVLTLGLSERVVNMGLVGQLDASAPVELLRNEGTARLERQRGSSFKRASSSHSWEATGSSKSLLRVSGGFPRPRPPPESNGLWSKPGLQVELRWNFRCGLIDGSSSKYSSRLFELSVLFVKLSSKVEDPFKLRHSNGSRGDFGVFSKLIWARRDVAMFEMVLRLDSLAGPGLAQ